MWAFFLADGIFRHSCNLATNHITKPWGERPICWPVLLIQADACMHIECVRVSLSGDSLLWSYGSVSFGFCLSDGTCKLFLSTDNTGDFREMRENFMFSEVVSVLRVLRSWVALCLFGLYTVHSGLVMEKRLVVSILNKTALISDCFYIVVVFLTEARQDSALNLTTNGTSSISMSVELNGVVYTGE